MLRLQSAITAPTDTRAERTRHDQREVWAPGAAWHPEPSTVNTQEATYIARATRRGEHTRENEQQEAGVLRF